METYSLSHYIKTICVTATSFPEGIIPAFEKLFSIIPESSERKLFGISRPDKYGKIIYKAAAELLYDGESEKFGLETFTIPKGLYSAIYITDYEKDIQQIRTAFDQLLSSPKLDKNGFCLEMYIGKKDVRCMVKLEEVS